MRSVKIMSLAAAMFAVPAVPATAAVIINSSTATGYNFVVDYAGKVGGSTTDLISALSTFTFNGVTNGGKTYNFGYSVTNDSSVASRLTSFGMNITNGTVISDASTGFFGSANINNNFPEGIGNIEACFEADTNGNCTGGSGGLIKGQTGTGTFSLTFASAMASVSLDDFAARYQSISPKINGSSSGVGIGALIQSGPGGGGAPITAPEPGTWMMMLGGFGLIGWAMRRRPLHARLFQPA